MLMGKMDFAYIDHKGGEGFIWQISKGKDMDGIKGIRGIEG